MIALPGMRRRFHLPEQGVHFFAVQASAGSHGAMTGHGAAHVLESFFEDETVAEFRQLVGEISDQARNVDLTKERRDCTDNDGAWAKPFEDKA